MQAMTLSIGNAGIAYFAQSLVADELVSKLSALVPPNRTLNPADFKSSGFGYLCQYSKIVIKLSNAKLQNFKPAYQSVAQLPAGTPAGSQFQLKLAANNFSVQYAWAESYDSYCCFSAGCVPDSPTGSYTYTPNIGLLSVGVTAAFQYIASSNTWTISTVGTPTAVSSSVTPNVPAKSVVQHEDTSCFSSSVSDTTANSIASIDFATPIDSLIPPLLKSIPASGQLGNKIVFEWELGDSGLTFPGTAGISAGITGRVSYDGTYYQGQAPATLPVPPVPAPTDAHHLQAYVSAYEVNALNWAFFQAGLLKRTVMPASLPNPNALRVETYVPFVGQLAPYAPYSMQADLSAVQPPVSSFQQVWEFTQANIDGLKSKLPIDAWNAINQNMSGRAYIDLSTLTDALAAYKIDSSYYPVIENGTSAMGLVVTQSIQMFLSILSNDSPLPNIVFTVARTDILTNLALGMAGTAQTMQFTFQKVSSQATFTSSSIPDFPGQAMAGIWQAAGESQYAEVLAALGKTGVPLPIMSGFQFTFADAVLSVQQGFVSILAKVAYKGSA